MGFLIIFFCSLVGFINLFHLINNGCYFLQNCLKTFLFKRAVITKNEDFEQVDQPILPMYTVLIPLYQEINKLESVINSIMNLNYPKHKLDVKIIVEADDYLLIKKIFIIKLPSYIHLIKVPFSLPRTKPKALNYAMQYSKGEYVVIYDAEDRPDSDQLLKAIQAFRHLPDEYACVQAKLNFYNAEENLLTKFFSLEYSLWFEYLLKGLSLFNLPVTLGGTSNHFKVDILAKVGYWDAYNVTEDADLGIRLYWHGYKVHMIDSYTLEEAPIRLGNWMYQRARWIKGFIQTFLVFLVMQKKTRKLKFWQTLSVYLFVGISSYNFYCLPWLLLMIIKNSNPIIDYLWLGNSFFAFSYLYGSALHILINLKGKIRNFQVLDFLALILWPFYFLCHTVASYIAIWESIVRPFKWNKTEHGVSSDSIDITTKPVKYKKCGNKKTEKVIEVIELQEQERYLHNNLTPEN